MSGENIMTPCRTFNINVLNVFSIRGLIFKGRFYYMNFLCLLKDFTKQTEFDYAE